jgi:hypothetical protein
MAQTTLRHCYRRPSKKHGAFWLRHCFFPTARQWRNGAKLGAKVTARPTFIIRLRPQPGVDAIRAWRQALKLLLRKFGLRVISIEHQERGDGR